MTAAQHELVLYSRDEHVVTITLNRSEKRNAFNAELVKELRAALLRFEADDDAFVAVLTGSGPCFSSGADVGERQIRTVAEFDRLGVHKSRTLTRPIFSLDCRSRSRSLQPYTGS
jgi:enoyl-CoA hydratase/carnithine racemase